MADILSFGKYIDLNEGGAFGHLSNAWDLNLTFSEMKSLISDALQGNLVYVEEKTDAVNLMVSYRKDRGMIAARNKSHLKNFGKNALDANGIRLKFKGRSLADAYGHAMDDLQDAVRSLSDKQAFKIFEDGRKWMSIEVMSKDSENLIEYGVRELRLHGTIEHNEAGEPISQIDKSAARMFDGMLRQRGTHKGGTYTIKTLNRVHLPRMADFEELESKYHTQLKGVMRTYNVSQSDTVQKMRENGWDKVLSQRTMNRTLKKYLIDRWANGIKRPTLTYIKNGFPDVKWIDDLEKNYQSINKDIMLPLEKIFLNLGADRLETMTEFMAINPDQAVTKLREKIDKAMRTIRSSGRPDLINKLELELQRLSNNGKILPTEGITFFWKGHFLKLTGNFAAQNQIIGILYRL